MANEGGLNALGAEMANASSGSRRSRGKKNKPGRRGRHRRLRWTLGILGLVIVLLVLATGGYGLYLNSKVHRVSVSGLDQAPTKGADMNTQNILMVGSTSRCALTVQNKAYGLCSQGVTGVNSDVIMILHLNPATKSVSILSIPRDLFIPNARKKGLYSQANKIDAGLFDGPSQLVASIEEDFGIPIQRYVELNFDTFANVVNALGGIKMYFPMPVFDAYSGLNIQTPGCHFLNGYTALQVVRARHLQYKGPGVTTNDPHYWPQEVQSDLARIRRDHEFIRVLAAAVAKKGLGNPLTDQQLVSAVAPQLTVDSGFTASVMLNMILTYHNVNPATAPQYTLPVQVDSAGSYLYKGGYYGSIEFPAYPLDQQIIDKFLGVSSNTDTMGGGTLPPPSQVTVSVLNGTGTYNQAADTSSALTALGFHVVGVGDSTPTGPQSETEVVYSSRTPADVAAAQTVAHAISGGVIMKYGTTTDGAQVTVVTGTDFSINAPTSATSTSTQSSSASTSSPAQSQTTSTSVLSTGAAPSTSSALSTPAVPDTQSASALAKPSPAVEPLSPWDPRSCTPSGGEGP